MKRYIIPIFVAGMMFTGCNQDLLEIEQKAAGNTAAFYQTDNDAQSALTAMYPTFINEIAGTEGIWNAYIMGLNYSADDVFAAGGDKNDHAGFRELNEFRYDASQDPVKVLYNHIYKSIYSANLVIDNFKNADSDTKKKAVAEARVMRAWAHMLAAIVYNRPPKIDHLLTNEDIPVNVDSQESLLKWCVSECEDAMKDLKERNGAADKAGSWVVTKGFAQFVAGKAALFAKDYKKVVEVMKPLVESPNYALVPGEKFWELFHVEGDGCSEKIFEFNHIANTSMPGSKPWEEDGSGKRGHWMVYDVLNWRGDDLAGSTKLQAVAGWGGGSINHDFAHKMLANDGDSYRRKATFITSDEFFYDESLCPWSSDFDLKGNALNLSKEEKGMDPNRGIKNSAGSFSRSDVMEVKNILRPNDVASAVGADASNVNLCLARLAEAYLIYAEACIQTGNNAEALKYINAIQNRAGSKTVSSSADMQVLMDEKQYELWFEGCRWNDLVRWGIAKEAYDKVLDNIPYQFDRYYRNVDENGNPIEEPALNDKGEQEIDEKTGKVKMKPIVGTAPHELYYEIQHPFAADKIKLEFVKGKHEYWPIPQSVLDVNPSMKQNPGW